MEIPAGLAERHTFYQKVKEQCLRTVDDRTSIYTALRNWYLFGTGTGEPAKFNKIHPHENLVAAYLYSQDTTYFATKLGESVPPDDNLKLNSVNKFLNDRWNDTNTDAVVGECVLWSLVFNTMLVKLVWWAGRLNVYAIPPNQFGVYREDVFNLDDQEAVVHITYITKSELALRLKDHERRDDILNKVSVVGKTNTIEQQNSPFQQILVAAISPNVTGNVSVAESPLHQYVAEQADELVEIQELWVWDDSTSDYRVATYCEPNLYIYDRENIFVKQELPFTKVTPVPLHNYFWGESEVQHLAPLQDLRERRLAQLARLFELQARTPKAATGMMGVTEEKLDALNDPGGIFADSGMGTGKVEEFAPKLPEHPFEELAQIDNMFEEVSGIVPILQGRGETGVRAQNQASKMAQLASARLKRRALIVEDSLEKLATLMLKVYRQESKVVLKDDNGKDFLLNDLTDDFVVKVSAHTSSPIFVEDQKQVAVLMLKAGVIDKRTFVELMHPPMEEIILNRLTKIEQADAARGRLEQEATLQHIRERGISSRQKK